MKRIIVFSIIFLASLPAFAASQKMTLTGTINSGTMLSSIIVEDKEYTFPSDSKVADTIFKACKIDDKCTVEAIIDNDNNIEKVISAKKVSVQSSSSSSSRSIILTINPTIQSTPDKDIKERRPVEVSGTIEFGNNAAGGNYWINGGKKKQYVLQYVWDLDDATQETLGKLSDSKTKVTVKGILKIWKDENASFDNTQPINIFK